MTRTLAFLIGISFTPAAAFAGTCCNTPTLWTFKNNAKNAVTLNCELVSSSAWSAGPVTLTTDKIAAGASYEHNWGSAWYSDGMGMIPGTWVCKDATTSTTNKKSKTAPTTVRFVTDWGENVVVTWKDSEPTVAKVTTIKAAPTKN